MTHLIIPPPNFQTSLEKNKKLVSFPQTGKQDICFLPADAHTRTRTHSGRLLTLLDEHDTGSATSKQHRHQDEWMGHGVGQQ
jgi:hypothetical protein